MLFSLKFTFAFEFKNDLNDYQWLLQDYTDMLWKSRSYLKMIYLGIKYAMYAFV